MNTEIKNALKGLFIGKLIAKNSQTNEFKGKKIPEVQEFVQKQLQNTTPYAQNLQKIYTDLCQLFVIDDQDLYQPIVVIDAFVDKNDDISDLKEYIFDIYVSHLFSTIAEKKGEEYMETPKWLAFEDLIVDRGTEAFDLFFYLQECKIDDASVDIDDFLNGFLLTEDDEFQDEATVEIYEELISNVDLVDEPFQSIVREGQRIATEGKWDYLLVPMFCFFKMPDEPEINLVSIIKATEKTAHLNEYLPITTAFLMLYNGTDSLPKIYSDWLEQSNT